MLGNNIVIPKSLFGAVKNLLRPFYFKTGAFIMASTLCFLHLHGGTLNNFIHNYAILL
jgi:hypothetical protein